MEGKKVIGYEEDTYGHDPVAIRITFSDGTIFRIRATSVMVDQYSSMPILHTEEDHLDNYVVEAVANG